MKNLDCVIREKAPADRSAARQEISTLASTSSFIRHLSPSRAVILFSLFSYAGWLYETVDNIIAFGGLYLRAQLMLPWCPIYGIGGLLIIAVMEPLRLRLRGHGPAIAQVAAVAVGIYVLTAAVELTGSYVCEWAMGSVAWDYSQAWGNFQGRIAPAYTMRFVALGLVALYVVYPAISWFEQAKPHAARRIAIALVIALIGDYTLQIAGVWDCAKDALVQFGVNHW